MRISTVLLQRFVFVAIASLYLSACGDGEIDPGPSALNDTGYCSDELNNRIVKLADGKLYQPEVGFYEIERTMADIELANKFKIEWSCDLFAEFMIKSVHPDDDHAMFLSQSKTLAAWLTGIPEPLAEKAITKCRETVAPKMDDKSYTNSEWRHDWQKTGARGVEMICFLPKPLPDGAVKLDKHANAIVPVIKFRISRP